MHTGNLVQEATDAIGAPFLGTGEEAGDKICMVRAEEAGLPGIYKVWLASTSDNNDPVTRFVKATDHYLLTNGVAVAGSWADLIAGPLLLNPINRTEAGDLAPDDGFGNFVWTNVSSVGVAESNISEESCFGWTSDESISASGLVGSLDEIGSAWTSAGLIPGVGCGAELRLYCFGQ